MEKKEKKNKWRAAKKKKINLNVRLHVIYQKLVPGTARMVGT
jgi:hypothetical protein